VSNLYLVDERTAPLVGSLRVCGIGGGMTFASFFDVGDGTEAMGGSATAGRAWATAWQVGALLERQERRPRRETFVFAISVSTATEPLALLLAASLKVAHEYGRRDSATKD
jgi:hypothetical protein